jgi:putative tryptophan/tyrosine transport system substrate-binding protein
MIAGMKRREFVTLLGGAAAAWPIAVRAQQADRVRRIGALMYLAADDPESPARVAAFARGLQELGWIEGRNIQIEYRWGGGDMDRVRRFAAELVALAPDVILVSSGSALAALQNATRTVPIVFVNFTDPVGAGYVASLSRPGANTTGFTLFEYGTSGKWLELLKQIAPAMTRAAVIRDPSITSGTAQFAAIQAVAPSIGVELTPVDARDAGGIEQTIAGFARGSNCGLIVTASPSAFRRRELIIALAARHRLPAVYPIRASVASGGLISYGTDEIDQQYRAAGYVDRILKGEKPADLPVQAPTKYELVINLKTAKALGLTVPDSLLARADEVIE